MNDIIILDGGLGSELEYRGFSLSNSPLWSSSLLLSESGAAEIENIHLDYFKSGAQVATTATYQLSFQQGRDNNNNNNSQQVEETLLLYEKAVQLAYSAKARFLQQLNQNNDNNDEVERIIPKSKPLYIAGSCGSFGATLCNGAEFTGEYPSSMSTVEQLINFHRPRISALLQQNNVDWIAFETLPKLEEVIAIDTLLRTEFPHAKALVSMNCASETCLSDGQPVSKVVDFLETTSQVMAIGVNCITPSLATRVISHLHSLSKKDLICYPNSGELWNGETRQWFNDNAHPTHSSSLLSHYALNWIQNGTKYIGGCCRTRPKDIASLVKTIQ